MKKQKIFNLLFAGMGISFFLFALNDHLKASSPIPAAGQPAPDFKGMDQDGLIHTLADYRKHWLVLYFFPKADTPGCTKEACAFRDGIMKLHGFGAAVIGVSMDTRGKQEKFARKYHIPFPLLADHTGTIAKSYGAAGGFMNLDHRYTFLIDPSGIIAKRYLDVDPERHADQIVRDLQRLSQRTG
jgi:peroxiredoxin Q/BCP